ncbi:hypothetical protein [Pseudoalteromonas ardens]|uniref:Uncharacterized protein n=1 Tax=Pseudoalteromonas rubra TaxID=43658 RepID=A0A0L0EVU6_9GAMM|nr:hypothetical protein [Pseudoalteromonas sp. R96]KNC68535.1 hypothetical protein AC626_04215 [Pseudoalteromonas rubra]MDK1310404.1 hypothetical protein [Pseudoalteromonas sp. R96]
MSQFKTTLSFTFSVCALGVALYSHFNQSPVLSSTPDVQSAENASLQGHSERYTPVEAGSLVNKQQHIEQLEEQVRYLQERVLELENRFFSASSSPEALEESVLAILEKKEQQERAEHRQSNPVYGFYEDLPDDYEMRLKTDPEYADKLGRQLQQKVLDESLPVIDRLSAMGQLQMNMYVLNRTQMDTMSYDTVDAVIKISRGQYDDKLRVQALDVVAQTPVVDARIARSLLDIVEKEENDYMRATAAEGLMSQYYQANDEQYPGLKRQLANDILKLYDNDIDNQVYNLMQRMIGDEDLLDQIRKDANK